MNRIAFFGAGAAAAPIIEKARNSGQAIAVADNDPQKWGKTILDLPIVSPNELIALSPDRIVLSATSTFPIYQQLISLGVRADRIESTLFSAANKSKWAKLKDSRAGETLFVVANGPSLTIADLDQLHEKRATTFAFNKIYLAFDETDFRPDYYLVEDNLVAQHNAAEIRSLSGFQKCFPDYLLPVLGEPDDETLLFYFSVQPPDSFEPKLSTEPFHIHSGYTCTFSAIQLALYMGFSKIVLLGLDFDFSIPDNAEGEILTNDAEQNHFSPHYRKPGETWNRPYLEQTRRAYQLAKQVADENGVSLVNASRHTKLDVLPRVDLEACLERI